MTAVFITSTCEWANGGPCWDKVGLNIAGLSTEISPKRSERHAFISRLIKKWSEVSKKRVLTFRPSQIDYSKNILRGFGP